MPNSDSFLYEPPAQSMSGRFSPSVLQGSEFNPAVHFPRSSSSLCGCLSQSMSEALESVWTEPLEAGALEPLVDFADFENTSMDVARRPSTDGVIFLTPDRQPHPSTSDAAEGRVMIEGGECPS